MTNNKLIYVVDDEKHIRELLKNYLEKEGYNVCTYNDGLQALNAFHIHPCDMLIIDVMMPNMDGFSLCKSVRSVSDIPIIIISAKNDEIDRILGLEFGSDDYIAKPFSPRELVVRVRNMFRRLNPLPTPNNSLDILSYKDIRIFQKNRSLFINDDEIKLTYKEFELINLLLNNLNIAFSREKIIENIWGYDYIGDTRQVDDLVKRVRKKLLLNNSEVKIDTIWGYGYKINK
ncbi:response regulator transcription factor [Tepidibacter hydrothermalis]|uniref:Stage 0 sporulation protein A homolog n=1 Tax=Tepidibacter hydrothermalis TaxID=3036126 RepID=A0ABY8ECV0_9FIRM|nr:response regulator transcription factor [Tepidibacter hydrothermalis]WFD10762.1 response regulator transcription factor [Tepidibacter hydrothermalis]